jgi:hypothetical protein
LVREGSSLRFAGGDRPTQEAILLALCQSVSQRGGSSVFLDIDLALPRSPLAKPISLCSERLAPRTTRELEAVLRDLARRDVPPKLVIVNSFTTAFLNDIRLANGLANSSSDSSSSDAGHDISKYQAYLARCKAKSFLRDVVPLCHSKGITLLWVHQVKGDFTLTKLFKDSKVWALGFEVGKALVFHCAFGIHIVQGLAPKVFNDRVEIQISGSTHRNRRNRPTPHDGKRDLRARYRGARLPHGDKGIRTLTLLPHGGFFYPSVICQSDAPTSEATPSQTPASSIETV